MQNYVPFVCVKRLVRVSYRIKIDNDHPMMIILGLEIILAVCLEVIFSVGLEIILAPGSPLFLASACIDFYLITHGF